MIGRALVLVAVLAGGARADDRVSAETFYRAGERAYGMQNFAAAAQDFEEAYKALPIPELAFSAAQAYRRQYRVEPKPEYVERAVALYRAYLDKVKSGGRVGDAADALDDMQRELDVLIKRGAKFSAAVTAEHTQLNILVELGVAPRAVGEMREVEDMQPAPVAQVHVLLDGKPVEPFTQLNVTPGTHHIHVEAPGYIAHDQDEAAAQGNSRAIDVVLKPKPGRVAVTTEDGARVEIDGRNAGVEPGVVMELPAGHHVIAVARRGRELAVREVDLVNDQALRVDVPLARSARRRAVPYLVWGAGGLAVASLGTTIGALVYQHDALAVHHQLGAGNVSQTSASRYNSDVQVRDGLRDAAVATGAAAVVALAVATGLYWYDVPQIKAARLVPVGEAGVGVQARF